MAVTWGLLMSFYPATITQFFYRLIGPYTALVNRSESKRAYCRNKDALPESEFLGAFKEQPFSHLS